MKYAVCVRCIADRLTRVGEQLCEQGGDDARVRGVYPARGQDVGQQHLHHADRHLPLPPLTVQPSVKREPPTAEQTQHTNHGRNEIENQHNLNLLLKYYISINRHRSQHFWKSEVALLVGIKTSGGEMDTTVDQILWWILS